MFTTIDEQRAFGDRLMVGVLWVMAVIITVVALLSDGSWLGFGLASAGTAAAATAAWRVGPGSASSRLTVAVATMAQVSLLVACQSGHPWQIDMRTWPISPPWRPWSSIATGG
jgi:methyl-accepting chemotaxis protein